MNFYGGSAHWFRSSKVRIPCLLHEFEDVSAEGARFSASGGGAASGGCAAQKAAWINTGPQENEWLPEVSEFKLTCHRVLNLK